MELKTLGETFSTAKAMMILSKIKGFKLNKTELQECLKNKNVVKKLQLIGEDAGILNKESAVKTVFNLCSSLDDDVDNLNLYLNFIFLKVDDEYVNIPFVESLSNIDDFEESLSLLAEAVASDEDALEYQSEDDESEGKTATLKPTPEAKMEDVKKPAAAAKEDVKKIILKKITLTSALENFALAENKAVYLKGGEVNFLKYDQKDLEKVYNKNAKLLIIDIETCKDTIYPVNVDLNPNSSLRDILTYIGKVLKEAVSKSLKCHADLHVYKIADLIDTDRIIYLNIKKL